MTCHLHWCVVISHQQRNHPHLNNTAFLQINCTPGLKPFTFVFNYLRLHLTLRRNAKVTISLCCHTGASETEMMPIPNWNTSRWLESANVLIVINVTVVSLAKRPSTLITANTPLFIYIIESTHYRYKVQSYRTSHLSWVIFLIQANLIAVFLSLTWTLND